MRPSTAPQRISTASTGAVAPDLDAPKRELRPVAPTGPRVVLTPAPLPVSVPTIIGNQLRGRSPTESLDARDTKSAKIRVPKAPTQQAQPPLVAFAVITLVALLVVVVWMVRDDFGGGSGSSTATESQASSPLSGYDAGRGGVPHSSGDGGYSLVLPNAPVESALSVDLLGTPVNAQQAVSRIDAHEVGVTLLPLAGVNADDPSATLVTSAAAVTDSVAGTVRDAVIVDHSGLAALDVTIDAPVGTGRVLVVHAGQRIIAVSAVTPGNATIGFDRAVRTLSIDP